MDAEESISSSNVNINSEDSSSRGADTCSGADGDATGGEPQEAAAEVNDLFEEEGQEGEEEEQEQLVSSFPEEDSRSRDGSAAHGLGDEESRDKSSGDNDDGASSRDNAAEDSAQRSQNEESNDSTSKAPTVSKENGPPSQEEQPQESQEPSLLADETLEDDEDEGENVVSEVDISSMMEVDYGEDSETNQSQDRRDEPEVIPIDSDDDDDNAVSNSNNDAEPVVESVDHRVFQVDDDDNVTEMDISSMMQVNFDVSSEDVTEILNNDSDSNSNPPSVASSSSTPTRSRPRRAAAEAAAKTIHQISSVEKGIASNVFRHRRKSQEDSTFDPHREIDVQTSSSPVPASVKLQKCHICKKSAACSIVIKQFGSDLFLCSNLCFNKFRNQGSSDYKTKTLPCAKCGLMDKNPSNNVVYFWETMNFCSELCVGRYQMDVGSKCCTCGKSVAWSSLGKYCVRFGSDIRQFCTPQCLEEYKKKARVCFNCQLDIRRVGNVILANIPTKSTPKEFCSNECVEMYCDRNLHQPTRAKPPQEHVCSGCQCLKVVHKELVLTNGSFKACTESCWTRTLKSKAVTKAEKCEMCPKFVNLELGFTTPVYWVSTMNKVHGFCSHVCKNLYILGHRKILSCTSCKVKKYNFDLIEYFTNSASTYAVCSLACLPKSHEHLKSIRSVLYLPPPTSDKTTPSAVSLGSGTNVISSVPSLPPSRTRQKRKSTETQNNVVAVSNQYSELQIGPTDNILDILTVDEIKAILEELQNRPKMKSVACVATPKTRTVETQTDISELNELRIIPLKISQESADPSPTPIQNTTSEKGNSANVKETADPHKRDTSKVTVNGAISGGNMSNGTVNSSATRRQSAEKMDDSIMEVSGESQIGLQLKDSSNVHLQQLTNSITVPASIRDINSTPTNGSSNLSSLTPSQQFSSSSNQSSVYSPSYSHSPYSSPVEPLAPNANPPTMNMNPLITSPSVMEYNAQKSPAFVGSYVNAPADLQPAATVHHPSSSLAPLGYGTHSHALGYNRAPLPLTAIVPPHQHTAPKNRVDYAIRAWRIMFGAVSDPRSCSATELSYKLCELISRGYSSDGQKYRSDVLLYISLGIQQILTEAKRVDKIFYDNVYYSFVLALTDTAGREQSLGTLQTVDELNFWETLELGATSPGVLLFTLIYMFKKHFGLTTWEMQATLQFNHIVLQSRFDQFGKLVKYLSIIGFPGIYPTEVAENFNHPERCFVKIYEFYCFKSEIREGPFYKCLRQDYTPRTPWFTSEPLHKRHIHQMLVRASMVKCYGYS